MATTRARGGQKSPTPYGGIVQGELTKQLNQTLELYQDERRDGGVPSPSTVASCIRRNWFDGQSFPRSNRIEVGGLLAAEQGKAEEVMVALLLMRAGFEIVDEQIKINAEEIGCAQGTADLILRKDDTNYLGEIKRMGLFRYLNLCKDGVKKGHPDYYAQIQLYMKALGLEQAILVAVSADYSAVNGHWNRNRYDQDKKPPPVWAEIVQAEPGYQSFMIGRAKLISKYIAEVKNPKLVPRDFHPDRDKWPCGYCQWQEACREVGDGPSVDWS